MTEPVKKLIEDCYALSEEDRAIVRVGSTTTPPTRPKRSKPHGATSCSDASMRSSETRWRCSMESRPSPSCALSSTARDLLQDSPAGRARESTAQPLGTKESAPDSAPRSCGKFRAQSIARDACRTQARWSTMSERTRRPFDAFTARDFRTQSSSSCETTSSMSSPSAHQRRKPGYWRRRLAKVLR